MAFTLGVAMVFAFFGVACGGDYGESSSGTGSSIENSVESSENISAPEIGESSSNTDESVEISVEKSEDISAPEEYETFLASELFPWIETLTVDNVVSLKQEYGGTCVPGSFATVRNSTEKSEITSILAYLNGLMFTEISASEGQVEGGGGTHLTITTAENNYTLYEFSKILYLDGQYYRYSEYIPIFTTGGRSFCFANLFGDSVLYIDGVEMKNYGNLADEILFVENDGATSFVDTGYTLEFDGGTLTIADAKTFSFSLFYPTEQLIYTIVGETDFSQIFADYPLPA